MAEEIALLSPSQITTYDSCQRKWGWQSLAKIPVESRGSAVLGSATHSILEHYLADGTLPDYEKDGQAAKIAASGLHLLPTPGSPMHIERHFAFYTERTGHLLAYNGLKDFEVAPEHRPEGVPLVGDHKTTSDFRWAKTPGDLRKDPQALIYAYDAMATYQSNAVDLEWIYYRTKGPAEAKRVHLRLTSAELRPEFDAIEFRATEMAHKRALSGGTDIKEFVMSLEPNPSACGAYGGCPFQHLCNLSPMQKMRAAMATGAASALERMKAKMAAQQTTTEAAPAPAWTESKEPYTGHKKEEPVAVNPPEHQPPLTEQTSPAAPAEAAAEKAPKGRGKKAKPEAKELPPEPEAAPAPAATRNMVLYINCVPTGAYLLAENIFAKARERVNKEFDVADYRFVQYGQGQGAFATAVGQILDEVPGDFGLVVDTSTPEGQLSVATMTERATFVIRGLR